MKQYEHIANLYKDSSTPTALADEGYTIVWRNEAAKNSFLNSHTALRDAVSRTPGAAKCIKENVPVLLNNFECYADMTHLCVSNVGGYMLIQPVQRFPAPSNTKYIAEDMRTHLSEMFSLIPALMERTEQDADTIRFFELMSSGCYALLRNSANLSVLSTLLSDTPLQMQQVNVTNMLTKLAAGAGAVCRTDTVPISVNCNGEMLVMCDERMLSIAFLNIINNSLTYTKDFNELNIRVKQVGRNAVITFSDKGIGIREDVLPSIFEPYYSCDPYENDNPRPGCGLGLSIVKALVQRCGGSYSVMSEFYSGTDITLSLPLCGMSEQDGVLETELAEYLTNRYSQLYVQLAKFMRIY